MFWQWQSCLSAENRNLKLQLSKRHQQQQQLEKYRGWAPYCQVLQADINQAVNHNINELGKVSYPSKKDFLLSVFWDILCHRLSVCLLLPAYTWITKIPTEVEFQLDVLKRTIWSHFVKSKLDQAAHYNLIKQLDIVIYCRGQDQKTKPWQQHWRFLL